MIRETILREARILVIDDDIAHVDVLRATLHRAGYRHVEVTTCSSDAVTLYQQFNPDLIVLDLLMPGLGGMEVLARLRAAIPEDTYLPILVVTGQSAIQVGWDALSSGATDFLQKPYQATEIILRVRNLLDTRFLNRQLQENRSELEKRVRERTRELTEANVALKREVMQREKAESALLQGHAELEARVTSRTSALASANQRLESEMAERHEVQQALRESESRLQAILDNTTSAIFLKSSDSRYLLVNRRVELLLGLPREEIVGRTDFDLLPGDVAATLRTHDQQILATREALEFEETLTVADGVRTYLTVKVPLSDQSKKPYAICGVSTDITDRKRVEEELKTARDEADRANRAKSEFLSRMSHELRTPLNAILGFAQVLELDAKSPEDTENVGQVIKAGRHLLGLINEVLDISRIEAGEMSLSIEPVLVNDVIQETLDLVRPLAATRNVRMHEAACDHHVLADRQRIKQVLLNLLSNAIKYNRDRGTVSIGAEERAGEKLRITVRDAGPGIAPEQAVKLFVPFERLQAGAAQIEGIGLGLAISKRLVELMGGEIGVESVINEGSTFWIELPLTDNPINALSASHDPAASASSSSGTTSTLLYIEDNLSNLKLVQRVLAQRPNIKVFAAMRGASGLELAREHKPDLILLDLHLPDVNGDKVIEELRAEPGTAGIPVVILSADATPGQIERLKKAGAREYLTKPLDVRRFLRLLDAELGTGAPVGE